MSGSAGSDSPATAMVILHLGVAGGALYAWGERLRVDGNGPDRAGPESDPGPHPRGLAASELARALAEIGAGPDTEAREHLAWLPTHSGEPARVSGNVYGLGRLHADDPLLAWRIEAFPLDGERAQALLQHAAADPLFADGLAAGADLRYWARVLRLTPPARVRQQGLPGLLGGSGRDSVDWEPVFGGPVEDRLATSARTMPHVARALTGPPADRSAIAVLNRFIAAVSDAGVPSGPGFERELQRRAAAPRALESDADPNTGGTSFADPDSPGMAALVRSVPAWRRPIFDPGEASFRLEFHLAEPDSESDQHDGRWRLNFQLVAYENGESRPLAPDDWRSAQPVAGARGSWLLVRAQLLARLWAAAKICPAIAASLHSAHPSGQWLSTRQAYEFMSDLAYGLEAAGFGVAVPDWWEERGRAPRLAARARVSAPDLAADVRLTLDEVVDIDWELALGGRELKRQEVEALVQDQSPLVRFRGRWLEVDASDLAAASEFLGGQLRRRANLREVVRIAIGAVEVPHEFDFDGVAADGRIGNLLARLTDRAEFAALAPPQGLEGSLRPYQLTGYSWLAFLQRWGLGACLADDMGLGKTIQTLALLQRDYRQGNRSPVLVICPTSVVFNWKLEAERFTPQLPMLVHHGPDRAREEGFAAAAARQAIVVTSYDLLRRDVDFLARVRWGGVVLDEAQNVKNPDTGRARAARRLESDYRIALTGTPVENHVGELWSLMEFLNPGLLGSRRQFRERFQQPIQRHGDRSAVARLGRITRPFILRRLKSDRAVISDLPEKIESKEFCALSLEQARIYAEIAREAQGSIESAAGMRRRGRILKAIVRLKQVCDHPALLPGEQDQGPTRSGKLIRLSQMLEEVLDAGGSALVFSQFVKMGRIIERQVREQFDCPVRFLHGGVGRRRRQRMVDEFQSGSEPAVFVLSLKAGGLGLNLTAANHVFHYDRWWNPAVENQATDRAFRIGQTRGVQVHKMICAGTLEEKIDALLERKLAVTESVIGSGEDWLTELSDRELRRVLELGREALSG